MGEAPNHQPRLEHVEPFLSGLGSSEHTAGTYGQALGRLAECIHAIGYTQVPSPYPATCIGDDILVVFAEWMAQIAQYRLRTIAVYLAAARRFLVWLDAHDHLDPQFSMTKAQNRLRASQGRARRPADTARPVDPELPGIVTYYDTLPLPANLPRNRQRRLLLLRNRAVVHTLYASAGRVSEIASITRAQVLDGKLDELLIRGKGGVDRVILLTPEAQGAIAAYCAERQDGHAGLFISHGRNRGKPLGRWSLWKVVKDAARALDLFQGTSPHDFRHYRAQQLLHEGMDLDVLQVYLGHADIATTRRIYAPYTALAKVKDQLATFGRTAEDAARRE